MSRLRLIFISENSDGKASYYESLYVSMNKSNVDMVQRLTWYIAKAHHLTGMKLANNKDFKGAYMQSNKALQYLSIHRETYENNKERYPFMADNFKTDE